MSKASQTYFTELVGRTTVHRGRVGRILLSGFTFKGCYLFKGEPQCFSHGRYLEDSSGLHEYVSI